MVKNLKVRRIAFSNLAIDENFTVNHTRPGFVHILPESQIF